VRPSLLAAIIGSTKALPLDGPIKGEGSAHPGFGLTTAAIKAVGSGANRFGRREVTLAESNHGARLRTLGTLGILRDKTHFVAHRELVEATVVTLLRWK
jgi:hypothetical protein